MNKVFISAIAGLGLIACTSTSQTTSKTTSGTKVSTTTMVAKPAGTATTTPKTNSAAAKPKSEKAPSTTTTYNFDAKATIYTKDARAGKLLTKQELKNQTTYKSLDEALKNPGAVYKLSIQKTPYGVEELDKRIGELYNLQELRILNIFAGKLPKEMGKLKNLESIDIQGFRYSTPLPAEIENWTNLKKFSCSLGGSENQKVPENFLDNLYRIKSLEDVSISSKSMTRVPHRFNELPKVKRLSIRKCPKFELPHMNQFPKTEKLILHSLPIHNLPAYIGEMKTLKILDVAYCKELTSISENIKDRYNQKTLTLRWSNNGIPKPEKAKNTIRQKEVVYHIENLPTDKNLVHKMEFLALDRRGNSKSKFDKVWKELGTYPNLRSISMESLPNQYYGSSLPSLKNLKVSLFEKPSQQDIEQFPQFLGKASELVHLHLTNSNLGLLSEMYKMKKLKSITLIDFEFKKKYVITDEITALNQLQNLTLVTSKANPFSISPKLYDVVSLDTLVLQGHAGGGNTSLMHTLPDGINKLANLKVLRVSSLSKLPQGVEQMNHLRLLELYHCQISEGEVKALKQKLPNTKIIWIKRGQSREQIF